MYNFVFYHENVNTSHFHDFILINNSECKEYDHRIWSELAGYNLLLNKLLTDKDNNGNLKYKNDDWISLSHYRRKLNQVNNFITVTQPLISETSIAKQYGKYHNIEDLKLAIDAVKEEYPNLLSSFIEILNSNILIPFTIGIMPVAQFKDYISFLFKILNNVYKKIGTNTYEERLDYISRHPEWYANKQNSEPKYQARIEAFLSERLSTLYWLEIAKYYPIAWSNIILLEENQKI